MTQSRFDLSLRLLSLFHEYPSLYNFNMGQTMASLSSMKTSGGPQIEVINLEEWEGPGKFAIIVHGVFNAEECEKLVERSENEGYEAALL